MTYYEKYFARYMVQDEVSRMEAKDHWLKCYAEDALRYGWAAEPTTHDARMLATIALADDIIARTDPEK